MTNKNFRSYQLALDLYKDCKAVKLPYYLRDQLLRALSSAVLNLSEGAARQTRKERNRYFNIAYASTKEVQAIIDLESELLTGLTDKADHVAASIYKLRM